jgi:hypothetical protein
LFLDELSQNRKKAEKFVPKLKRLGISVVGGRKFSFQPKWGYLERNNHRRKECPIKSKKNCKVAKEEIEFFKEC